MIFYIARPSVLQGYKFFHKPPIKVVKPNLIARTIEIWFNEQPDDESFTFYRLEKVLPGLTINIGECWKIATEDEVTQSGQACYKWIVLEKNIKLEVES